MANFGYNKNERDLISRKIELFMKTLPENWDWNDHAKVTDKPIHEWEKGDIIDVQSDHLKIYIDTEYTKTNAKKRGNFYQHGYSRNFIIYYFKRFPDLENPLVITGDNWKMKIVSYDGALRIYKRITGKKLEGFVDYGREIYY